MRNSPLLPARRVILAGDLGWVTGMLRSEVLLIFRTVDLL